MPRSSSKMNAYDISISDRQMMFATDEQRLRDVIERVLSSEGILAAEISLALVGDAEIHRINRDFLGHDYPTDVISFLLSSSPEIVSPASEQSYSVNPQAGSSSFIEGELVVSTETATREAAANGWSAQDELLLYVVHGLLHLCGYDDLSDEARPAMRARERELLAIWNLTPTGLEA